MKWSILALLCCSTALAHPPGVKLSIDAEVTGVIREAKGEFYVEREQTEAEARAIKEAFSSVKILKQQEQEYARRWKLDTSKVGKEQVAKLVGKKVEVVGKSSLTLVEGGVPGSNPFNGRDLLEVAREIRMSEIREVK